MATTIEFYEQDGTPKGRVTIQDDGTMTGDNENMQGMADQWRLGGGTPQKFIAKYSLWGNGYQGSQRVIP